MSALVGNVAAVVTFTAIGVVIVRELVAQLAEDRRHEADDDALVRAARASEALDRARQPR